LLLNAIYFSNYLIIYFLRFIKRNIHLMIRPIAIVRKGIFPVDSRMGRTHKNWVVSDGVSDVSPAAGRGAASLINKKNEGMISILVAVTPLEKQRDASTNRSHTTDANKVYSMANAIYFHFVSSCLGGKTITVNQVSHEVSDYGKDSEATHDRNPCA
jgi:hypothetical protein